MKATQIIFEMPVGVLRALNQNPDEFVGQMRLLTAFLIF
jgi:hypothetical protein